MKLYQFALALALPFMAVGCGGDIFGSDGGNTDSGAGVCPAGTTLYKLLNGSYTLAVTGVSDPCNIGFAQLQGAMRKISNDNQGNVNLLGSMDSTNGFGQGQIFCNKGNLTANYTNDDGAGCTETISATTIATLTADNRLSGMFTQTRSNRAAACMPMQQSCQISATVTWSM